MGDDWVNIKIHIYMLYHYPAMRVLPAAFACQEPPWPHLDHIPKCSVFFPLDV